MSKSVTQRLAHSAPLLARTEKEAKAAAAKLEAMRQELCKPGGLLSEAYAMTGGKAFPIPGESGKWAIHKAKGRSAGFNLIRTEDSLVTLDDYEKAYQEEQAKKAVAEAEARAKADNRATGTGVA